MYQRRGFVHSWLSSLGSIYSIIEPIDVYMLKPAEFLNNIAESTA